MEVEDVAGIGLATGRSPQEQAYLPVGPGVFGEVIVDDEHVLPLFHELLAHGAAGVRGDVLQSGRIGGGGHDHNRVIHGPILLQGRHHAGHVGLFLPDGHVDTDQVLVLLIDDGVNGQRRFACLSVADDQLPLPTADGDHRVYGLDARLHGGVHRLAGHHARGDALDLAVLVGRDRTLSVNRLAHRIDHSPDERFPYWHRDDAPGAADRLPLLNVGVVAHDDDTHVVRLQVEDDTQDAVLELDQLAGHRASQAGDAGYAVAYLNYRAHVHSL